MTDQFTTDMNLERLFADSANANESINDDLDIIDTGRTHALVIGVNGYAGQWTYFVSGTQKLGLAKADSKTTSKVHGIGILSANISTDQTAYPRCNGSLELSDWTQAIGSATLTAGAEYYLSKDNAGMMVESAPSTPNYIIKLGYAETTTKFVIAIEEYLEAYALGVTASGNLTDNAIIRGDGGAKGVQDSGVLIDDADNITGVTQITATTFTDGTFTATGGKLTGLTEWENATILLNGEVGIKTAPIADVSLLVSGFSRIDEIQFANEAAHSEYTNDRPIIYTDNAGDLTILGRTSTAKTIYLGNLTTPCTGYFGGVGMSDGAHLDADRPAIYNKDSGDLYIDSRTSSSKTIYLGVNTILGVTGIIGGVGFQDGSTLDATKPSIYRANAGDLHVKQRLTSDKILYLGKNDDVAVSGTNITLNLPTTLANGNSFSLYEDITFLGATGENKIVFPDGLNSALEIGENGDPYIYFRSAVDEKVEFWKNVDITNADIVLKVDTSNFSNPPTDAELDAGFGAPVDLGSGWMRFIDDNGAGTNFYLVVSDGTNWWQSTFTKCV